MPMNNDDGPEPEDGADDDYKDDEQEPE